MNRNNKYTASALCCIVIFLFFMAGCYGGSRGLMRFDELNYPASMSPYLYGPNNEILTKDRDLIVIRQFRFEVYYPAFFYSLVPPMHTKDVGQRINAEVENCGGDGIVNVKISSNTGFTTYMHPLTLLPLWPSYTTVVVEGDVVKYEPSTSQNAPKTEAFGISDDVLILDATDETATVRLNDQCRVSGKIDTLFSDNFFWPWVSSRLSWKTMRSAYRNDPEEKMTILDRIKIAARERGSNVAQILYVTFDLNEVEIKYKDAKAAMAEPGLIRSEAVDAALDIRYWSCP